MATMAAQRLLALFDDDQKAAAATEALEGLGLAPDSYDVLTGVPYPEGAFGEHVKGLRLYVFPFVGAALGLATALLLTIGTQVSYPVVTGGKPILSIPPMAIVAFEHTLLGAILFTVIGVVLESRLPRRNLGLYDDRITEGFIGLLVECPADRLDGVRQAMEATGAEGIKVEGEEGAVS